MLEVNSSSLETSAGAHMDWTTLLASIEALRLLRETEDQPITFDLLMSLSQFIESIVLQDRLFVEEGTSSSWTPYLEVIGLSGIEHHLCNNFLVRHTNVIDTDELRLRAIKRAVEQVESINLQVLHWAVEARASCHRGLHIVNGFKDEDNPFQSAYRAMVYESGDKALREGLEHAVRLLKFNGLNEIGVYILARIFLLQEWLGGKQTVSYSPHFTRSPLALSAFKVKCEPIDYRRWSIEEVRSRRAELVKRHTQPAERTDLTLHLSPIFLACLVGANHRLDILWNAINLREDRYAKRFRRACRQLEQKTRAGICPVIEYRTEVEEALNNFEEVLLSRTHKTVKATGGISFLGPKAEITFERSMSQRKESPVLFLTNILRSSIHILSAEPLLSQLFGEIPRVDSWLLERLSNRSYLK
jgi:hypothetical protein